jgi:hypothetical protein
MSTQTTNMSQFIAYFEEPEPGVPVGSTGWYHSNGQFPLSCPEDAFRTWTQGSSTLLKPQIAGPFTAREQAIADLEASLNE